MKQQDVRSTEIPNHALLYYTDNSVQEHLAHLVFLGSMKQQDVRSTEIPNQAQRQYTDNSLQQFVRLFLGMKTHVNSRSTTLCYVQWRGCDGAVRELLRSRKHVVELYSEFYACETNDKALFSFINIPKKIIPSRCQVFGDFWLASKLAACPDYSPLAERISILRLHFNEYAATFTQK
ncbi:hypothetical protein e1116g03.tmp0181 [Eimeria tenella]|uniref:Uncharacterized protein n=1 Tax=Eimeria tenella TaxID=5802 RepID=C8TE51_EIMTE|nr:hypothetical protein e1116g03.tmp0181 [Eimeria tenella]